MGEVWKNKPGNWSKVNKDPEELLNINDLIISSLHSALLGKMLTPFSRCRGISTLLQSFFFFLMFGSSLKIFIHLFGCARILVAACGI